MRALTLPGGVDFTKKTALPLAWEEVPMHPTLAAAVLTKRRVHTMREYLGVMYVGYGDGTSNLGPVDLIGYDVETLAPITSFEDVQTEYTGWMHVLGGDMYVPWSDPLAGTYPGGFLTNAGGTWHEYVLPLTGSVKHMYDMLVWDGHVLISGSMTGLSGVADGPENPARACVIRGTGGGEWEYVLLSSQLSPTENIRFYDFDLTTHPGEVRVQSVASSGLTAEAYRSTDGVTWAADSLGPVFSTGSQKYGAGLPNPPHSAEWSVAQITHKAASASHYWVSYHDGRVARAPFG